LVIQPQDIWFKYCGTCTCSYNTVHKPKCGPVHKRPIQFCRTKCYDKGRLFHEHNKAFCWTTGSTRPSRHSRPAGPARHSRPAGTTGNTGASRTARKPRSIRKQWCIGRINILPKLLSRYFICNRISYIQAVQSCSCKRTTAER